MDEDFKGKIEQSLKIIGFQDCIIELLKLKELKVDISQIRLSEMLDHYKESFRTN